MSPPHQPNPLLRVLARVLPGRPTARADIYVSLYWLAHWAALLAATALLWLGPTAAQPAGRLALIGVAAGTATAWVARRRATGVWWTPTPLDVSLWALTLAGSAAYVTASYVRGDPLAALARGLVFWLGLSWTAGLAAPGPAGRDRAWRLFALAGLGLAVVALVGGALPFKWPGFGALAQHIPRLLPGLPGAEEGLHPNEAAGMLLWFLPVPWLWLQRDRTQQQAPQEILNSNSHSGQPRSYMRLIYLLTGVAMGLAWLLLQSRAALLGAVVASWSLLLFQGRRERRAAVLALLVIVAGLALGWQDVLALLTSTWWQETTGAFDPGWRELLWRAAGRALQEFPVTGLGLGQFRSLGPHFYLFPLQSLDVAHAHNIWLHTAAEMGVPGVVALLAVWLGLAGALWRALRPGEGDKASPTDSRPFLLAAWWSLVAFSCFGLVDMVALGAKGSLVWWAALGLAIQALRETTEYTEGDGTQMNADRELGIERWNADERR